MMKAVATFALSIATLLSVISLPSATSVGTITVTRDLPKNCIAPGENFTVTITINNYTGMFCQVRETLEDGLTFVGTSLDTGQVRYNTSSNEVSFILLGQRTFTYTVRAPYTEGTYHITGIFKDDNKTSYVITGGTTVCVRQGSQGDEQSGGETGESGGAITVTRDLPKNCIAPGENFTVTITINNYTGMFCQVRETLEDGLTFVGTSLDTGQVRYNTSSNEVSFILLGQRTFTYTVRAPYTEGTYHITGIFKDDNKTSYVITGGTTVCVSNEASYPNAGCSDADFVLHLKAGWNLVSIPKPIHDVDAVVLFNLSTSETAYYYDASSGNWINDHDIIVKPCQAYWVYKEKDETICIYYDKSILLPPSQQLYPGWNMVGHIDDVAWSIDDFLSVTGLENKCSVVCTVDHQGMPQDNLNLKCYYPTFPGLSEFNVMTPGWGYWVFMKEGVLMPGTAP